MVLFSDGQVGSTMETAENFSAWAATSNTPTITATSHHGANAVSYDPADLLTSPAVTGNNPVYARFYFRMPTVPAGADLIDVAIFTSTTSANILLLRVGSNYLRVRSYYPSAVNTDSAAINWQANVWYCLEMYFLNNAAGEYKAWVDGSLVCSRTGVDTTGTAIARFKAGNLAGTAGYSAIEDCYVVDTSYIGPESSGIQLYLHNMGY